MDKTKWTKLPVIQRFDISHNTALYRFAFPRPTDLLDLPIGQHLSVMAEIDGKEVFRSYTPISQSVDRGYLDLVVKSYPNGTLSKYFAEMELGDELSFRGPKGNFVYKPNMCREIGMIAGGTGITPMLQVVEVAARVNAILIHSGVHDFTSPYRPRSFAPLSRTPKTRPR